jgi:hypothetical protein
MAELRPVSRAVYRVGVYSASSGESSGKIFDVPEEAMKHFMELAQQKFGARMYAEFVSDWLPVEA